MRMRFLRDAVLILMLLPAFAGRGFAQIVIPHPELRAVFDSAGYAGTAVIFDEAASRFHVIYESRADSAFLPASTFKIPNSLIALETGAIASIHDTIRWDGTDRGWDKWNTDMDMAHALRYSAVWFYQRLAEKIGKEKYQHWLRKAAYGNEEPGPGLTTFWLEGDLRINAWQQVNFLRRLNHLQLPFSEANQLLVKAIMENDPWKGKRVFYKTGWAIRPAMETGWVVGWIENGDQHVYWALNISAPHDKADKNFGNSRIGLMKILLEKLGYLN